MALMAMDPKLAGMDPKMLQALSLGLDPKLLGMAGIPGASAKDQQMLAALGMAGLGADPKSAQAQAQMMQAQAMQLQQQLAMTMGMGGLDAKTLAALGMPGLDANTLAALAGGAGAGLDMKQLQMQQQQQQDAQTKALAQLMGGSLDPKLLGMAGAAGIPGLAGLDEATKKALGIPSTPKAEEKSSPSETPKPAEATPEAGEKPETAEGEKAEDEKTQEGAEDKDATPAENGDAAPVENGTEGENKEETKNDEDKKSEKDKDGEEVEEIINTNEPPATSLPTPNLPDTSVPSSIPGLDAATMKALGSLGQMDPKTMKTNGLDPNLLKSLGIGASTTTTPTTSKPIPSIPGMPAMSKMPGMEGLDNETLKLLAQGDPSAMQKLMANPALMGMDPRMMGLDMAALMGGGQAKAAEQQLLKQFGLDPSVRIN